MTSFFYSFEAIAAQRVTLPDQVRAEARRRGGAWSDLADDCALKAEKWFGRRPCRGEDLHIVFDEIFGVK